MASYSGLKMKNLGEMGAWPPGIGYEKRRCSGMNNVFVGKLFYLFN
jgi:hypothetical protein